MKKRIFSTILCIIMLLPIVILATVPAAASEVVEFKEYAFFYNYLGNDPVLTTSGIADGVVSIPAPDKQAFYFGMAYTYSGSDSNIFKAGYTYQLTYTIGYLNNKIPTSHPYMNNIFVGSDMDDMNAISYYYPGTNDNFRALGNYVSDLTQTYVYDSSSNIGTLDILFHCDSNVPTSEVLFLVPVFLLYQQNGDSELITYNIGFELEGVSDFDQQIYDDAVFQQQTEIKNAIESGFQETNSSLNEIKDVLTGDGDYTFEKNDELQSSIKENAALEEEIYDSILNNTVELPNGDTISTDSLNFNDVYLSIEQTYNAPVFEEDMAAQIDKIFDIFMSYLGTVIFLSLTLGLCIAFLTGRRLQ